MTTTNDIATSHISKEASFEYWPLDADGKRLEKDGSPVTKYLRFSKVDMSALAELEEHLRRECLVAIMPMIEQTKVPAIQQMIIAEAMKLGDNRRIGTREFDTAVKTLSGISYLAYLSLRRLQPEMNPKIALKVVSDVAAMKREMEFNDKLFSATGFDSGKEQASSTTAETSQAASQ